MKSKSLEDEFVKLIQQYELLIYKVVNVYTSAEEERKDLFQEIVLQAWHAYEKFEGRSKASTWLYRVALNTAINHQRKKKYRPNLIFPELILHDHVEDLNNEEQENYKVLQSLITALPKLDKALILLYLDDKSYKEIADIIGISSSNVGTKINRIKDRLRKQAEALVKN